MTTKTILAGGLALAMTFPAAAQQAGWQFPAVENYGPVVPVPEATAKLEGDLAYKVVFNVTQATPGDGRVSPDLASVARFVNLLAISGMDPAEANLVAVVHGAATAAIISDAAYGARFGTPNPNAELVRQLEENGVEVVVCGQAVAGAGFGYDEVMEPVEVRSPR